MRSIASIALSSAFLLSPLAVSGAFAQTSSPGSNAPATVGVPAKGAPSGTMMKMSGPSNTMAPSKGSVKVNPMAAGAQTNPPGAQPGTGSGMGKTSGTANGN